MHLLASRKKNRIMLTRTFRCTMYREQNVLSESILTFMDEIGEGFGEDPLRLFFRSKVSIAFQTRIEIDLLMSILSLLIARLVGKCCRRSFETSESDRLIFSFKRSQNSCSTRGEPSRYRESPTASFAAVKNVLTRLSRTARLLCDRSTPTRNG
jgi:hypothetical protein